jgi:hypothetical protein
VIQGIGFHLRALQIRSDIRGDASLQANERSEPVKDCLAMICT